jgi:magnesium-protoporphyrin O-methyltransferase
MSEHCCGPAIRHFDQAIAEQDLVRYREKGLDKRARLLVEALLRSGAAGRFVLDVGSGAGTLSFELLNAGVLHATLADASPAYLTAARLEATRLGLSDRVETVVGDFVETAARTPAADIVILDRVVCCYPAWPPLLAAAKSRSRGLLGLTYPRARPDVRLAISFENLRLRMKGDAFRAFVHPPAEMRAALRADGWRLLNRSGTFRWHVELYGRA